MRYTIRLSYNGLPYCGWQLQPNAPSVQEEVEKGLSILLGAPIRTTGAGRTDTGVSAVNFCLHFDFEQALPLRQEEFASKLDAILPSSIAIHSISEAPESSVMANGTIVAPWNARFSALAREYKYFLHLCKDPFIESHSCRCWYKLDIDKMNQACRLLLGTRDFSCFEKTGGNNKTSICTLTKAEWSYYTPSHVSLLGYPDEGNYLVFTIRADRFLRNMVRAIVGSSIEVGRGRKESEWFRELLEGRDRSMAGQSVPGHALFLCEVEY